MTDTLSPDRERDAKIAEALGFKVDSGSYFEIEETEHSWGNWRPLPRYSTDPVAFDALLQEIGRRGLGPEFLIELALAALDKETLIAHISLANVWQMFSAPISTKAAAALAVLTETTNG